MVAAMAWLNYHHLFYFWTVVREGGVTAASRKLRLAQPTVSGQLKALEESLDVKLFERQRGRLVLTESGTHVYRYADEIFSLGRELQESLAGRAQPRARRLVVGVAEVMSKLIAQRILAPALAQGSDMRLVVLEAPQDRLLADLAVHALDLVLTDAPVPAGGPVRAFNHLLGETGVTFFAKAPVAKRLERHFPRSLEGVDVLLPAEPTQLRRGLERWFDEQRVRPRVRGEFQDLALLHAFGQAGAGVFPGATAIEDQLKDMYGVEVVGRAEDVRERFYAVTVERRLTHPAVRAISEAARGELFAT